MKHKQLAFSFTQDKPSIPAQKGDVVMLVLASVALATTLTFIAVMATLDI